MSPESGRETGDSDEVSEYPGVLISITGEPRYYAGTRNTWLWYRGTGVGPYPCMSALQALELLCDQILEHESMPPSQLIRSLLLGCENLAMPALAFGLMVRHIERFGSLIDPYLIEPLVWDLEAARVSQEFSGFAARAAPPEPETAVERRRWIVGRNRFAACPQCEREPGARTQRRGHRLLGAGQRKTSGERRMPLSDWRSRRDGPWPSTSISMNSPRPKTTCWYDSASTRQSRML